MKRLYLRLGWRGEGGDELVWELGGGVGDFQMENWGVAR